MNISELIHREKELETIIEKVEKEIPTLPKGNIRVSMRGKYPQYFVITEKGDTKGKYVSTESLKEASDIAKRNYYEKLKKEAEREVKAIKRFLTAMSGKKPEEVYDYFCKKRQRLVTPLLISDEQFTKRWTEAQYEKNTYHPEECRYETKKGDLVRSKSEAMIADMYYELGIPYRYEAKVVLNDGKIKYPDFTLLKLPERIEIYHEHMGLMEDELYRASNITKLQEYAMSGIITGKNLILTFETDYAPLNIRAIRKNVKSIFIKK